MMRIVISFLLVLCSASINAQESELTVRYDFKENSSPPMKIFYIKVFVDEIFADSTKPHMPHHNLANAVRTKISMVLRNIRIEGWVKEEKGDGFVINKVMDWNRFVNVAQKKCRVSIKMNESYEVVVYTGPYE